LGLVAAAGDPHQALAGRIEVISDEDVGICGGVNLERVALAKIVERDIREVRAITVPDIKDLAGTDIIPDTVEHFAAAVAGAEAG
jgi:ABC-type Zn uptake system ZnuABC Zn-binding protein ZnuA